MQQELQAKLLVLKAFYLGRSAEDASVQADCKVLSLHALSVLQDAPEPSEENLRRRLFYMLLLAELERDADPVPWRREAKQLGERLKQEGLVDPFVYYLEIVRATTGLVSPGNVGDGQRTLTKKIVTAAEVHKVGRFGAYTELCDLAADALGLSMSIRKQFAAFLHKTSLSSLLRQHGIDS
jgi:hypothetical protein